MRKRWQCLAVAGLIAASSVSAAAAEVHIWKPTPVPAPAYDRPAVNTQVTVVSNVYLLRERRSPYYNDYTLDPRYGGYDPYYVPYRYPF